MFITLTLVLNMACETIKKCQVTKFMIKDFIFLCYKLNATFASNVRFFLLIFLNEDVRFTLLCISLKSEFFCLLAALLYPFAKVVNNE